MFGGRRSGKKMARLLPLMALISGGLCACTTVNYTSAFTGKTDRVRLAHKNFVIVGPVTVQAVEKHSAGPLGIVKTVEGSKVTYTSLIQKAANMEADDIIDVRIDVNTVSKTTLAEWLTGWTRTYTFTGTAIAIRFAVQDSGDMPRLDTLKR